MKSNAVKARIGTNQQGYTDDASATARWERSWPARRGWIAFVRTGWQTEWLLYPLVCGCGLFAIAAHFYAAVPVAHQIELAWLECLRWTGHS